MSEEANKNQASVIFNGEKTGCFLSKIWKKLRIHTFDISVNIVQEVVKREVSQVKEITQRLKRKMRI
jgi:hypothetical protein